MISIGSSWKEIDLETLAPPTAVPLQRLRLAGWLLALSPVAFAVVTVAWGATFADTGYVLVDEVLTRREAR